MSYEEVNECLNEVADSQKAEQVENYWNAFELEQFEISMAEHNMMMYASQSYDEDAIEYGIFK
jgi:hypothetical protein